MICTKFTEDELIQRATAAWLRWCRRKGYRDDQPCAGLSVYQDGVVTLKNANGPLAAYKVTNGSRLRRLEARGGPDRAET